MITCKRHHLEFRCFERGYTLDEVRDCIVNEDGDDITVDETHPSYPRVARPRPEHQPPELPPAPERQSLREPPVSFQEGPGSELKSLLATFGIHASPTCKCNSMAQRMNAMESQEPGWCLAHIEEIVDVMEETARARKLPFLRTAGKLLVKKAVKNWHKKATGK
jgi:hypothetical protein